MKTENRIYRIAYWLSSFIIAAVLLSGYQKLLYPADFAVSVYRFHLLPGFMVNFFALYMPWLEVVCAFCLLFVPCLRIAALWIVFVLLVMFSAAIAINLWRGSVFGCGCFGRGSMDDPLNWMHLMRNIGLIVLVVAALVARKRASLPC